jgi:hypothetical protein
VEDDRLDSAAGADRGDLFVRSMQPAGCIGARATTRLVHEQQGQRSDGLALGGAGSCRTLSRSSARPVSSSRTSSSPDGVVAENKWTIVRMASRRGGSSPAPETAYGMRAAAIAGLRAEESVAGQKIIPKAVSRARYARARNVGPSHSKIVQLCLSGRNRVMAALLPCARPDLVSEHCGADCGIDESGHSWRHESSGRR